MNWSVQEGSAGGTVDQAGNYTAPGVAGTFHVVATSQADTSKSAVATVTVAGAARLTTPPNGMTGVDATHPVSFAWTRITNVRWYQLWLGSSQGANDLYNGSQQTSTSLTLTLQSGRTYYARLFTTWFHMSHSDSTFATATGIARLQSPADGATGVSQFQPFTWNTVPERIYLRLIVSPTNFGTYDMFSTSSWLQHFQPLCLGLQPNTRYYATMCTQKGLQWYCSDSYVYHRTARRAPQPRSILRRSTKPDLAGTADDPRDDKPSHPGYAAVPGNGGPHAEHLL